MKSKHCTYGEKITLCSFDNYHSNDIVSHKSTITAMIQIAVIAKNN